MITLLEPPRPSGLTSGGFRYQERLISAIGPASQRITTDPRRLHGRVEQLLATQHRGVVVVDGWFADLCDAPAPRRPDLTDLPRFASTACWRNLGMIRGAGEGF